MLGRLAISFACESPEIDESARPGETPSQLVRRLAETKARRIAENKNGAIVIGSDQVAILDSEILGKPGNHERAREQLLRISGKCIKFVTGLSVLNTDSGSMQTDHVLYTVYFRMLTDEEVDNYLRQEQPYHCAGSFKSEHLGISLLSRMEGDDPTALIGLPLIRLAEMLRNEGIPIP